MMAKSPQSSREQFGGHAADGCRADGGDSRAIHNRTQQAVLGVKEQPNAPVRVILGAIVAGEGGNDFDTHRLEAAEIGGHQTHQVSTVRKNQHCAQRQKSLTSRQHLERPFHHADALAHG